MRPCLIVLGKRLEPDYQNLIAEYLKRLPRELKLDIIEHEGFKANKQLTTAQIRSKEAELLESLIPADSYKIVLDEAGKQLESSKLAKQLQQWQNQALKLCFIIGGAYGIAREFIANCDYHWSLSKLTLPHQMVRLIVVEQLYRAWTINQGHPYHK